MEKITNIPIKGYASFHPLKHCMVGKGFEAKWFDNLFQNKKISDPFKRIADETEEDYLKLIDILKSAGVKVYRPDPIPFDSLEKIGRPPVAPRDHFATIGTTFYACQKTNGYGSILKKIKKENLHLRNLPFGNAINTAQISRVGKDLFWDSVFYPRYSKTKAEGISDSFNEKKYKELWESEGFRVHTSHRGYHNDGSFCIVKPGLIVSLFVVQNYTKEFPNWDVLYLPDQSWNKISPFRKIQEKVKGRWWLKGEEDNNQLIEFVNSWLNDWVGYVEETVFDVNMLSLDENTIICNNYNKEVFAYFKKHKVEPILFNFRHRYFWDDGVHCITQDFYREGKMEDYFG